MRIVCPNCDTAYDAPPSAVSAGRRMRCAKCRSEWMPIPPSETVALPAPGPRPDPATIPDEQPQHAPVSAPEPADLSSITAGIPPMAAEPVIRAPFPEIAPTHEPNRNAVIAGWVASVLVIVLALFLAIAFREAVMRHWPASARAYAALGYK